MEVEHHTDEQKQLDAELDELADDHADGAHQAGEIDFAENAGIGNEGVAGIGEAGRKIAPDDDAAHLKQHGVDAIGTNARHHIEEQHTHGGGEGRLYEVPERPQQGLFVPGGKVAFHKQDHQVAVLPEASQVGAAAAVGFDDG